jgi:TPR repeat protein
VTDRASSAGLTKAEYAVGYFTEMGIGCRRDPLEANVWYVRAAEAGDERAKYRLAAIRAAAAGGEQTAAGGSETKGHKAKKHAKSSSVGDARVPPSPGLAGLGLGEDGSPKKDDKECVVM